MENSTRMTRSKARIDLLVAACIEFASKYPSLSINTIATTIEWTQSSLGRALESRDLSMPERTGRESIQDLVYGAAMEQEGYPTLEQVKEDIQILKEANTAALPEPEPTPEAEEDEEVVADEDEAYEASLDEEIDDEDYDENDEDGFSDL
jgi:hypothetical protein